MQSRFFTLTAATLLLAGCSAVTDFDRFHFAGDGGGGTDSGTQDGGMDGAPADGGSEAGPIDGGPGDGGGEDAPIDGCTPVAETCDGVDEDCDGMADDGAECPGRLNATGTCASGTCTYVCNLGYADCDVDPTTCESDVTVPERCGTCTTTCPPTMPLCSGASGSYVCDGSCAAGTVECSGSCVDTTSSPMNCGSCGNLCSFTHASARCVSGMCQVASCLTGYADCDGNPATDCEPLVMRYVDSDGDGYGRPTSAMVCPGAPGYASNSTDCNDTNASINPGRPEVCNGVDDDCDGMNNEGFPCSGTGATRTCTGSTPTMCSYIGTESCTAMCNWSGMCTPPAETCNGADDDCDALVDEEVPWRSVHIATLNEPGARAAFGEPDLAFNGREIGVVWSAYTSDSPTLSETEVFFASVDPASGAVTTLRQLTFDSVPSLHARITWIDSPVASMPGDWLVAYVSNGMTTRAGLLSGPVGGLDIFADVTAPGGSPIFNLVDSGSAVRAMLLYSNGQAGGGAIARMVPYTITGPSSSGTLTCPGVVGPTGRVQDIDGSFIPSLTGWGLAYGQNDGVYYVRVDSSCTYVSGNALTGAGTTFIAPGYSSQRPLSIEQLGPIAIVLFTAQDSTGAWHAYRHTLDPPAGLFSMSDLGTTDATVLSLGKSGADRSVAVVRGNQLNRRGPPDRAIPPLVTHPFNTWNGTVGDAGYPYVTGYIGIPGVTTMRGVSLYGATCR